MNTFKIWVAMAAILCSPALADAQTKTVTIDGMKADIAIVPNGDLSKNAVGESKQDILDLASKATPMVIVRPASPSESDRVVR